VFICIKILDIETAVSVEEDDKVKGVGRDRLREEGGSNEDSSTKPPLLRSYPLIRGFNSGVGRETPLTGGNIQ
jgi:hypothetical protein